jgi:AcrR family transcriptional regulator
MTRQRILTVAHRALRKHGSAALSLRQVAGKVGVTPMAIYRHFKDKDDLLEALVADGFARWETYLAEAVRADAPWARVERALLAYAEFAVAEPRLFELMFMVPRPRAPIAPQSLSATSSPSFGVVIASFSEALGTRDVADSLLLGWAAAHGLICLHFSGRFGYEDERFRTEYARVVRRLLTLLQRPAG